MFAGVRPTFAPRIAFSISLMMLLSKGVMTMVRASGVETDAVSFSRIMLP